MSLPRDLIQYLAGRFTSNIRELEGALTPGASPSPSKHRTAMTVEIGGADARSFGKWFVVTPQQVIEKVPRSSHRR